MSSMRHERNRFGASRAMRGVFVFSLVVLSILVIAGHQAGAEPHYGGTLRMANELDAIGFDAIKGRSLIGSGGLAANLIMEKLFELGADGELIPILGLSADASEDGKRWIVTLRQGVKFHDGTPFNAEAVVKHWERLLNPENRYRGRMFLRTIASVETAGEFKVRFTLEHAWKPFLAVLAEVRGFASLIPSPRAVDDDVQNRAPVGTGPFIFKEWKPKDRIVVVKNPDYWRKGKPYLDKIVFRPISDHDARYNALVSGQVDMMTTERPNQINKLLDNPDYAHEVVDLSGAILLALNNSKPPLDDVRVRRALAHAWDQKKYIKTSFKNVAPFTEHWLGDALECEDAGYLQHDVEKAKALLAEYGKPVELEYVHSATTRGRETALILQRLMKEVGVKVTPVPLDFPGIMKKVFSKKYDISSWLIAEFRDMDPMTEAALHSKSPWNIYRYADEEIDKLLAELRTGSDPEAMAKTRCTIVEKVNTDAPFLYLYGRNIHLFAKNNIKNITNPKHFMFRLDNVWLEPEKQ